MTQPAAGGRVLSDSERLDWLRLYRSENVGPATFFRLLNIFGSPARALDALPDLARRGGFNRPLKIAPRNLAEREIEAIARLGGRLLCVGEPGFPIALAELEIAPVLHARGRLDLLTRHALAMVGARNASLAGRRLAQSLAGELGRDGLVITSGFARGIDTAAHESSLATGTVAVMAGGLDVIYPPENAKLYERVIKEGCVVSEMPPASQPQAAHFPRRNRLISGLSLAVLVIEASAHSGSLITARFALEQGRDVLAVPGSPLDARSHGPNSLIKQGAALIENATDVIDALSELRRRGLSEPGAGRWAGEPMTSPEEKELAPARKTILSLLGPTPVEVDEIIRECRLPMAIIATVLLELEMAGRLERHPGNRVSLLG